MATWKKIIVSGSNAHLNQITASSLTDNNIVVAGVGGALESSGITYDGSTLGLGSSIITSTGATSVLSGSFSGSFQGDGSNLTGLVSSLTVSGSDGTGGVVDLQTQDLTITGTANEIETSVSGQTVTIGLPNNVTIGNNLTVTGDLTVNGTTATVSTTNLLVEDRFILLASGSTAAGDGGLVVEDGGGSGNAFFLNATAGRWSFHNDTPQTATTQTAQAFAAAVVDENAGQSDDTFYQKNGNIRVDTNGDIFIYA